MFKKLNAPSKTIISRFLDSSIFFEPEINSPYPKPLKLDRYSSDYKLLKKELGILPPTLSDAVNEFEDKLEYEMLKENLGLKDYTND